MDAPPEGTPIEQFSSRGYEVAKLLRDGTWEQVGRYRDNNPGLAHAKAMVKQMNAMGHATYQVRALLSVEVPPIPSEETLVLEADEPAAEQSTPSFDTEPVNE